MSANFSLKITGEQQRGTSTQCFARNTAQQCEDMGFRDARPHKSGGERLSPSSQLLWGAGQSLAGAGVRGSLPSPSRAHLGGEPGDHFAGSRARRRRRWRGVAYGRQQAGRHPTTRAGEDVSACCRGSCAAQNTPPPTRLALCVSQPRP